MPHVQAGRGPASRDGGWRVTPVEWMIDGRDVSKRKKSTSLGRERGKPLVAGEERSHCFVVSGPSLGYNQWLEYDQKEETEVSEAKGLAEIERESVFWRRMRRTRSTDRISFLLSSQHDKI